MCAAKVTPLPTQDDGQTDSLPGNVKVMRQDWLNVAMDLLVSDGVEQVKVLTIGERLEVSRSSFYWYFKSRQDLLDALLEHWEQTNTAALIGQSKAPAETITEAVCNVFRCFVDPSLFNNALDFAVREWARRSGKVRTVLDRSDSARIGALEEMFRRFGYPQKESLARARTLYYMQIGYNTADLKEDMSERLKLLPDYLVAFTGKKGRPKEIRAFEVFAKSVEERTVQ
ncbi:TetR/AcrR family transcriptional regulator [Pelagibius sp. Alg239-R121]|uniref:TetR/AcrR family transcriptional regulator n=1 Tax=Pelagibius sp. Alg239-R121 TaxID=2993448 RepID=UPI0024A616D7|nr:TetR/AcrR family transcriptional regulator [Pelagibius sp. Alg239-R121]